jgi:DNA-binding beta-propeller fold protein YncE
MRSMIAGIAYEQFFKLVVGIFGFILLGTCFFSDPAAGAKTPEFMFEWGRFGVGDTPGTFAIPRRICIDSAGNVYVTDTGNSRVQKFTEDGAPLLVFPTFFEPDGIDVDDAGYIYVSNVGWGTLSKFNPDGTMVANWGSEGSGDEQFQYAYSLIVKGDMIYLGDRGNNRIQTLTTDGQFRGWWRGSAPGVQEFVPMALSLDLDGNLLIVTLDRILRFTTSGEYLGQFGSRGAGDGQMEVPADAAVDETGNIYLSDTRNNRIQMFDPSGNFVLAWGTAGSGRGQFDTPYGLAVNSGRQRVYVVDRENDRIEVFTLSPLDPYPRPNPAILLHIGNRTEMSAACSSAPESVSQIVTSAIASPDGSATYFLYLLASPSGRDSTTLAGSFGLTGIQLGIEYNESAAPGQGLEILDWHSCSSMEWSDDNWPASGYGITQTWDPCREGDLVVAGYFDLIAYSPSTFAIVGWPHTALVKTAGCDVAEQVLEELSLDHVGWVSLGGAVKAGDDDGCNPVVNPCTGSVPVHKTTWGNIKSMFQFR